MIGRAPFFRPGSLLTWAPHSAYLRFIFAQAEVCLAAQRPPGAHKFFL
jgi:hypothetical protein